MIRNAGGIATDDALRSLIVSHHLLDTQEFIIINHTDCGLLKVREDEVKDKLARKDGRRRQRACPLLCVSTIWRQNVRQQMTPGEIASRGFRSTSRCGDLFTT